MKTNPLTLEETLTALYRQHAVLLSDATVWPSTVSRRVKQGVKAHREELLEMLAASDYRVCPASWYHWQTWSHAGTCETCARLAPEMEKLDHADNSIVARVQLTERATVQQIERLDQGVDNINRLSKGKKARPSLLAIC